MMFKRNNSILIVIFSILMSLVVTSAVQAQWALGLTLAQRETWTALPPYNIMWPLWSPTLSPPDPVTTLPTPLISELASDTILPVQPVIGYCPTSYEWPMGVPIPWLFYNGPAGVVFFDAFYGLNTWPPVYLTDPITGAPAPITWLSTWTLIGPWDAHHFEFFIPLGNATYALTFGLIGQPYLDLLTAAQLFDLPPIFPY